MAGVRDESEEKQPTRTRNFEGEGKTCLTESCIYCEAWAVIFLLCLSRKLYLKISVEYAFLPKALWGWDSFCGMLLLDSGGSGVRAEFSVACPSWLLLLNKLFLWNFPCQDLRPLTEVPTWHE